LKWDAMTSGNCDQTAAVRAIVAATHAPVRAVGNPRMLSCTTHAVSALDGR
jgi:hypothetical protein